VGSPQRRGDSKLKATHSYCRARAEIFLLGLAINRSLGVKPAMHDGSPGAAGTGKYTQRKNDRRGGNPLHAGILSFPEPETRQRVEIGGGVPERSGALNSPKSR
jgi:hypothetical protein